MRARASSCSMGRMADDAAQGAGESDRPWCSAVHPVWPNRAVEHLLSLLLLLRADMWHDDWLKPVIRLVHDSRLWQSRSGPVPIPTLFNHRGNRNASQVVLWSYTHPYSATVYGCDKHFLLFLVIEEFATATTLPNAAIWIGTCRDRTRPRCVGYWVHRYSFS